MQRLPSDLAMDLNQRHWTRNLRGLTLVGTWFKNEHRRWRPCIAIYREGEEYSEYTFPAVISVDDAWIWSEEIGEPAEAARRAFRYAERLRLDTNDPRTIIMIASMINDHLDDLLTIPPRPTVDQSAIAEVIITDHTSGKTREAEIKADV